MSKNDGIEDETEEKYEDDAEEEEDEEEDEIEDEDEIADDGKIENDASDNDENGREEREGYAGAIYIFTNPSFPDYVKIGYSDNWKKRLDTLNASSAVPFPFSPYAVYYVTKRLKDNYVHDIIDKLNPRLRSKAIIKDKEKNRERKREFYLMQAGDAYNLLDWIAKLSDTEDRLNRMAMSDEEKRYEKIAEQNQSVADKNRAKNFTFTMVGIKPGETITFINDPSVTAEVYNQKKVKYKGEIYSLSHLSRDLLKSGNTVQGAMYWAYNGKRLTDIRKEMKI